MVIIAVASALILWILGLLERSLGGFIGIVIHLIIAALVLIFTGKKIKGPSVKGFVLALIAAIAIGLVS